MSSSSEPVVQTISGRIAARTLGHTQCHEHIFLRRGPSFACNPALCMDDFEKSLQELKRYRAAGGDAIVDAQPGFFGRDVPALCRLSAQSGVKIIAVTGFHKLQFLETDAPLRTLPQKALTDHFISELQTGMIQPDGGRSAARAGLVKCAFEKGGWDEPAYHALFEAAAAAAAHTGAPVMVHTEAGNDVLSLIEWFRRRGVAPGRLLICHLDRTNPDADYHRQVLRTGCTLCYDSIHRYKYVSDAQELALLRTVLDAGFSQQLVLSLDTTNQRLRAYHSPDMGLDYILTEYIPMLRRAGISEMQLLDMCRNNAARILEFYKTEV